MNRVVLVTAVMFVLATLGCGGTTGGRTTQGEEQALRMAPEALAMGFLRAAEMSDEDNRKFLEFALPASV